MKKRQTKSKSDIAKSIKIASETSRLREFSEKKFYPFLKENTKSVADTRQFLQILDTIVKATFNEGLSKTTIGDLNLYDKIKSTAPDNQQKRYKEAFDMFKDETLIGFIRIVSDFQTVVGGLVQEWEKKGKLEELDSPFPKAK